MKKIRVTLIIALILFLLDAFCLNQGILAFIALLYATLFILPKALSALKNSDTDTFKYLAKKSGIYFLMAMAVFETNSLNNKTARYRAEQLVCAVNTFKSKHTYYPLKLEDLVPEFLPAVPRSKYTLFFNTFTYIVSPDQNRHSLMYVAIPPFGRRYYSFENTTWGFLD